MHAKDMGIRLLMRMMHRESVKMRGYVTSAYWQK